MSLMYAPSPPFFIIIIFFLKGPPLGYLHFLRGEGVNFGSGKNKITMSPRPCYLVGKSSAKQQ